MMYFDQEEIQPLYDETNKLEKENEKFKNFVVMINLYLGEYKEKASIFKGLGELLKIEKGD